jgi:lipoate-protein ligase A
MALDEALLAVGGERAVLRFYTFEPHALSLGYFQGEFETSAARAALAAGPDGDHDRGRDTAPRCVRRFTGGGAIHHAAELTFSIAAPLDHPLYRGTVAASYERVHGLVATALRAFGVDAEARGARVLASERTGTGMCFHQSSSVDLVWPGPAGLAKGVGSAQRRRGGRVLHHGSIKLWPDALEPGVATLAPAREPGLAGELAVACVRAFEDELGARFEIGDASEVEAAHAASRAPWFGSAANLAVVRHGRSPERSSPHT